MLFEILQILKEVHSGGQCESGEQPIHRGVKEMKRLIAKSKYYGFVVERYIHYFINNC